ncbi:CsbD family protein [Mycolicibacterium sp. CBM1]
MADNRGPQEGIKGVLEDVEATAKEAAGTVTGRGDLTEEGKAQQDRAEPITSQRSGRKPSAAILHSSDPATDTSP